MDGRLLGCLLVLLTSCTGESASDEAGAGRWPLTVPEPGVLGYVAAHLPEEGLVALSRALLDWSPEGLGGGPLLLVPLDPSALGGSAAVVLPIRNDDLFWSSLQRWPALTALGEDRFRLAIAPDSALGMLMLGARGMGATPTLAGALRMLGTLGTPVLQLHITTDGERAWIMPSFEAGGVCRNVVRRIEGLAPSDRLELVVSLDAERVRTAYHEEITRSLAGVQGMLATAEAMARREGADVGAGLDPELPEALLSMSGLRELRKLQVHLRGPSMEVGRSQFVAPDERGAVGDVIASAFGAAGVPASLDVTATWNPDAALLELFGALEPAPPVRGVQAAFGLDHGRAAAAFERWWAPARALSNDSLSWLGASHAVFDASAAVEVVGPGAAAYFLVPWETGDDVGVEPPALPSLALLVSTRAPQAYDPRPMLEEFAAALDDVPGGQAGGIEDRPRFVARPDGRFALVSGSRVELTTGRTGDVIWMAPGDVEAPPSLMCRRVEEAVAEGVRDDPLVWAEIDLPELEGRMELDRIDGGVHVTWRAAARDDR